MDSLYLFLQFFGDQAMLLHHGDPLELRRGDGNGIKCPTTA